MSEKRTVTLRVSPEVEAPRLDDILNDALRRELVKGLLQILEVKRGLFAGDSEQLRSPFHMKEDAGEDSIDQDRNGGDAD